MLLNAEIETGNFLSLTVFFFFPSSRDPLFFHNKKMIYLHWIGIGRMVTVSVGFAACCDDAVACC